MIAFQCYPPIRHQQMRELVKKCLNDPVCADAIGKRLLIDANLLNDNEEFFDFILMLMILLETSRIERLDKDHRIDACDQGIEIIGQTMDIDGIDPNVLQIYKNYFIGEFNNERNLIQTNNTNFGKRRLKLKYVDALYDKYVAFYK